MDTEDPRTIGARLRQIRRARRKSLRVIAGLARMSKSKLDRIERRGRARQPLGHRGPGQRATGRAVRADQAAGTDGG
ncbi:MAG: helix-turn-helix domain-containing protein [Pseudonocardiaceae bacterium]